MKIASIFSISVFFLILHAFSVNVFAEIFVHDMVAIKNEEILLKAETRGRFSRKGGELVEFFIDGKTIGKALSGGDGFAFKQFSSSKTGSRQITIKSTIHEVSGILLVLGKKSKIVFVEFEEGLIDGRPLKWNPRDGSQNAIKEINKRYPVVILQAGIIDKKMAKEWLKKYGYIDLPVIAWDGGDVFEELAKKDIKIKAVIGSSAVINSARKYKPLFFSFSKNEGSEQVVRWEEIKIKLQK